MSILSGDTLLPSHKYKNIDCHLWVVLTDPDGDPLKVVMVNMTSLRPNVDTTVILDIGEHPFVRYKTVINYGCARFTEIRSINKVLEKGLVTIKDPASDKLLQKIQNGLLESMETPKDIKEYCRKKWSAL